jgi:hypothetical protein
MSELSGDREADISTGSAKKGQFWNWHIFYDPLSSEIDVDCYVIIKELLDKFTTEIL